MYQITIIMPVYNCESEVGNTIESILDQSFTDFKLIIINDGSTDKTLNILNNYLDKRIEIVSQTNQGVSVARNVGLRMANTKYTCFIDSDDYLNKDYLKELFYSAEINNSDMAFCNYRRIYNDKIINVNVYRGEDKNIYINSLLTHDLWGVLWNKIFKTEVIKNNEVTFQDGISMWEDLCFCVSFLVLPIKISFVDKYLYDYINRGNSLLNQKINVRRVEDQIKAIGVISNLKSYTQKCDINLITSMMLSKSAYLTVYHLFDYDKWSEIYPVQLRYIFLSKLNIKIKLISILAKFRMKRTVYFIAKLKFLLSRFKMS
ncbi:glycosyltransferase [Rosenbergiella epipactidis]|uniref:glycosyltransferase n=1 Tax=Rosenbergiella epipactidis TaxID=1544694 RepID=UPI0020276556|nr:glycosyltransferase [Rosenbergiella epipactidis]MCL9667436.1 glycosyltransferase [Rosenbergiella epipactidis]